MLSDGSCVRVRASWPNHVWPYDFVEGRIYEGKKLRMLCLIDEFTREALAIRVRRKLKSIDVLGDIGRLHDRQPTWRHYPRCTNIPAGSPHGAGQNCAMRSVGEAGFSKG